MSALPSSVLIPRNDPSHDDRVVLFGGSARTLDLLRLAVIRSDNVLLLVEKPPSSVTRFADAFAVEMRTHARPNDLATAGTVLVAVGDIAIENAIIREARVSGTPLHVADRPLVSDFTLLEFLEQQATTFKPACLAR